MTSQKLANFIKMLPNVGESSGIFQNNAEISPNLVALRRNQELLEFGAVQKCANRVDFENI